MVMVEEDEERKRQEEAIKLAVEAERNRQQEVDAGICGKDVFHEGYAYSTVQIGDQCWFAENCRYLPMVTSFPVMSNTNPRYYVAQYGGTDVKAAMSTYNYKEYGVLYNWYAVMTDGICPSGWHIPSDADFKKLLRYLGGEDVAGLALKSHYGWLSGSGSNVSGFSGKPGGYCYFGSFNYIGSGGYLWSASESGSFARNLRLWTSHNYVGQGKNNKDNGYSARCLRD